MNEAHEDEAGSKSIVAEDVRWVFNKRSKLWIPQHKKRKWFRRWKTSESKLPFVWLNLIGVLAIPFVVTFLGLYATQQITQQQAQLSIAANKQQQQTNLQIADDQQRETTLKTYLDDMSDLLLNHNLSKSKPGDVVREIARERTLTVLRRLDSSRNGIVLQFLQDAGLIGEQNVVIDLSQANMNKDDLSDVNLLRVNLNEDNLIDAHLSGAELQGSYLKSAGLVGADLSGTDLSETDLSFAYLTSADLIYADIIGANLTNTYLNEANLTNADLEGDNLTQAVMFKAKLGDASLSFAHLVAADLEYADLRGADLSDADLTGANIIGANLRGVLNFTQQQLDEVSTCKDAILPTGLICHHNSPYGPGPG
jgi:uncharacterized protein YjbI with pentapeptide repeats